MKHLHTDNGTSRKDKFLSKDGILVEYNYIDNKSANTVAFVNGWGTTTYSEWSKQIRIRNYNLLFFNNRGNGGTELGNGEYMHSCASDLAGICSAIGLKELNLVGHSMGGLIETLFYTKFRDGLKVNTVTFVSTPDDDPINTFPYRFLLPGRRGLERLMSSYQNGVLGDITDFAERSSVLEKAAFYLTRGGGVRMGERAFSSLYHNFLSRRDADIAALRSMQTYGHEIGVSMSLIEAPVLIVHATEDFFVSPKAAMRIHERVPESTLHIFDHSTHAPMFEQASDFNRIFLQFLDINNKHSESNPQQG